MLEKVKTALQLSDTTFDDEILANIETAKKDMERAGIDVKEISEDNPDYLYEQCIVVYCAFRFELLHGSSTRSEALERIYKEQKRMLGMATGYTTWSD